ncbi:hypothetical protein GL267_002985 [Acidithiobacillus ferrianus]|uniref:Uncharacterized protein n=2 Tax=Acidithiobacillus ferrianus TaxID=2678518 RepID=A0A845U935_9PROT|nr:hypothetical protein [Acidithiobacillus ferrianus]NDU43363.1 hypothetical protein [Acidithiobacillus ferrianus]
MVKKVKTPEQEKRAQKYRCKLRYEMAVVKLKVRMKQARKIRDWKRLAAIGDTKAQEELISLAMERGNPAPVFPA